MLISSMSGILSVFFLRYTSAHDMSDFVTDTPETERVTFHKSKIQHGQKSDMDLIQRVLLVTRLLKQKPGNLQIGIAHSL